MKTNFIYLALFCIIFGQKLYCQNIAINNNSIIDSSKIIKSKSSLSEQNLINSDSKSNFIKSNSSLFNKFLHLEYEVKEDANVKIFIVDKNDNIITMLVDKFQNKGKYTALYMLPLSKDQVYYYKMITDKSIETKILK